MIGKTISEMMAVRLWQEILLHTYELGGTTVEIFGSKGSAKTTLMLKIAEKVCYKKDDAIYPEPVIWRARLVDQWNWFEGKDIRIFVHKEDNPKFYYETGEQIYLSVKKYFDPEDILENLKKFNVVYEPTKYEISKNLVGLLARRGGVSAKTLEDVRMDSSIWWFEFLDHLIKRKSNDFISIMMDEADEVFPENPSGLRWHLQLWFKDNLKDVRKRNLSFYFSAHSYADVDSRIRTKMQYHIYLKGAKVPNKSLIEQNETLFLKVGQGIIERDGYGKFTFDKIREKPKILTLF